MNKSALLLVLCFLSVYFTIANASNNISFESTKNLPVVYQGRIRSLDSVARLWLYDFYHSQQIKSGDVAKFHGISSANNFLWQQHLLGHRPWADSPLFWIHLAETKQLLQLDVQRNHFSFNELINAFHENKETNLRVVHYLLAYEYALHVKERNLEKVQLSSLSPDLWVGVQRDTLYIIKTPQTLPWHFLTNKMPILSKVSEKLENIKKTHRKAAEELIKLLRHMQLFTETTSTVESENAQIQLLTSKLQSQGLSSKEIALAIEENFPIDKRIQNVNSFLRMVPSRLYNNEWLPLDTLLIKNYNVQKSTIDFINNFTFFSDSDFNNLQSAYSKLKKMGDRVTPQAIQEFVHSYTQAYASLQNQQYKKASGKYLAYPSFRHLYIETLYQSLPLITLAIVAYFIAFILLAATNVLKRDFWKKWGIAFAIIGFIVQSTVLIMRCYVLQRPPVSNMFETIVYVPWISVLMGFIFYFILRSLTVLAAGCFISLTLLILLKLTHTDSQLENVQAVLDSQYWLIVHVLMVVGSYGAFILSGILGHVYLISTIFGKKTHSDQQAKSILYTMYLGVGLLIPGTILGGVWAAESWGRFWDWDPKESWAFISACIYLLIIHAYTFKKITDFGLAVGAIAGLIAISFTWYGVNYVLGTGLHSYGFGKGGEGYYFLYVLMEALIILGALVWKKRQDTYKDSKVTR